MATTDIISSTNKFAFVAEKKGKSYFTLIQLILDNPKNFFYFFRTSDF